MSSQSFHWNHLQTLQNNYFIIFIVLVFRGSYSIPWKLLYILGLFSICRDLPASTSQELGLRLHTTRSSFFLKQGLYIALDVLELTMWARLALNSQDQPASASWVLELKAQTTTTQPDLKLLIFLSLLSECWDYRCDITLDLCDPGDWIQDFVHANQVLLELNYIPSPEQLLFNLIPEDGLHDH